MDKLESKSIFLKEGSTVHYVHKVDTDVTEVPNISPAIVTKMKKGRKVNLFVMTSNGTFHMNDVPHGGPEERGTWHRFEL